MKKTALILIGSAAMALAACGGKGDDALAHNVEDEYKNVADNLTAEADNTADPVEKAKLEAQAAGAKAEGESLEKSIDKSDVNAATVSQDTLNRVAPNAM